jgi:hypothetical protein
MVRPGRPLAPERRPERFVPCRLARLPEPVRTFRPPILLDHRLMTAAEQETNPARNRAGRRHVQQLDQHWL